VIRYRALWVVPISGPPIRDGWVAVDGGRVTALGQRRAAPASDERDLGDFPLIPVRDTAHTHL
jgi:hypothetical protein